MNKELELKYLVEDNFDVLDVLRALTKDNFIIMNYKNIVNVDKYFDTRDKELLKMGAGLRIRENDGNYKVTFKAPDGKDNAYIERFEIEKDIPTDSLDVAIKIVDCDMNLSRVCPFPVLVVTNKRTAFILKRGEEVIEVSHDIVKYYNPSLDIESNEVMVEIEGKDNVDDYTLENINHLLKEKFLLEASSQTKYERGLMLTNCQKVTRKREKEKKNS